MTLEAMIFDLDGVLVDTMQLHFDAWDILAAKHKRPFDQAMKDSFRGLRQTECIKRLFPTDTLSQSHIQDLLQEKNDAYQQAILDTAAEDLLADGVLEFLRKAKEMRFKLGIASSSVSAKLVTEHTTLTDYVDVIADGFTVNNGKPATDIFVWVAGALRAYPGNCIAFEDSLVGIQATRQAGMYVVGIGHGEWLKEAHVQYPQLSAMPLDDLIYQANVHHKEVI